MACCRWFSTVLSFKRKKYVHYRATFVTARPISKYTFRKETMYTGWPICSVTALLTVYLSNAVTEHIGRPVLIKNVNCDPQ